MTNNAASISCIGRIYCHRSTITEIIKFSLKNLAHNAANIRESADSCYCPRIMQFTVYHRSVFGIVAIT